MCETLHTVLVRRPQSGEVLGTQKLLAFNPPHLEAALDLKLHVSQSGLRYVGKIPENNSIGLRSGMNVFVF